MWKSLQIACDEWERKRYSEEERGSTTMRCSVSISPTSSSVTKSVTAFQNCSSNMQVLPRSPWMKLHECRQQWMSLMQDFIIQEAVDFKAHHETTYNDLQIPKRFFYAQRADKRNILLSRCTCFTPIHATLGIIVYPITFVLVLLFYVVISFLF